MKRYKIGFLAVIAILAMSFTVASHEGAFKKAAKKAVDCYTSATKVAGQPNSITIDLIRTQTTCPNAQAQVTTPARIANFSGTLIDPLISCTGAQNFFCCARKSSTNQLIAVFCKPTNAP